METITNRPSTQTINAQAATTASNPKGSSLTGLNILANTPDKITDNPLSQFMTYQYNVALSLLPIETCSKIQSNMMKSNGTPYSININTELSIDQTRADRSVTLASTGETKRNFANLRATWTSDGFSNMPPMSRPPASGTNSTRGTPSVVPTTETSSTTKVKAIDPALNRTNTPRSNDPEDPIIGTYNSAAWNYYAIDSITVENVLAPSANNPSIADMLTLKMRILEPHGFQLVEDIRLIADGLGYGYVPTTRYMWRIDIWFSGYDMNGNWHDNIPLPFPGASTPLSAISYYMNLATMEAKVDGKGTAYELGFVPNGHQAWRPEDVVFDAQTMINSARNTFGDFLDTLQKNLKSARAEGTNGLIQRNYEFYCPDAIRNAKFNSEKFFSKKNLTSADGGGAKSTSKDVDVIRLLQDAWVDCETAQDYFLADGPDNDAFTKPRVMLVIEFNVVYGENVEAGSSPPTNKLINDYSVITHQYKITPFVTFKRGTPTPMSVPQYLDPTNQVARVKEMLRLGMVNRVYNYLFTGQNTEVINLNLEFQNFYYYIPLWTTTPGHTPNAMGMGNTATAGSLQTASVAGAGVTGLSIQNNNNTAVDATLSQLFGAVNTVLPSGSGSNPFQRISVGGSGVNTLPYPALRKMVEADAPSQRSAKYLYYLADQLQKDMLVIDLEIRGDPIWMMSAYANGTLTSLSMPSGITSRTAVTIIPKGDRCIFIKMFAPVQDDYMNPSRTQGSSSPLIIGGFYQVLTVMNTFQNGKFTQKLTCSKYEHLNYIEQYSEKGYGRLFLIPPGTNDPSADPVGSGRGSTDQTNLPPGTPSISRPLTTNDVDQVNAYLDGNSGISSNDLTYQQKVLAAQQYLVDQGYTTEQANAVVGNWIGESSMNTGALNIGDASNGTNSYGIMQWNQERLNGLQSYASSRGLDISDLNTQMGYAVYEGQQSGINNWARAIGDPGIPSGSQESMTQSFMQKIERPRSTAYSIERANGAATAAALAQQAANIRK